MVRIRLNRKSERSEAPEVFEGDETIGYLFQPEDEKQQIRQTIDQTLDNVVSKVTEETTDSDINNNDDNQWMSYQNSENRDQDIEYLNSKGFNISQTIAGEGGYGIVYIGTYGPNVKDLNDIRGNPLRNCEEGQQFAAKFVDFKSVSDENEAKGLRDSYEIEKYIMNFAVHPNIVSIRFAFNFGQQNQCILEYSNHRYLSYDRLYLFMDYADLGDLFKYMRNNSIDDYTCLKFTRQLFSGLRYLHNKKIFHGDIKVNNVLLFTENNESVAKWSDFGFGYVSGLTNLDLDDLRRAQDCRRFGQLLEKFVRFCKITSECSQTMDKLIQDLDNFDDLNYIYENNVSLEK